MIFETFFFPFQPQDKHTGQSVGPRFLRIAENLVQSADKLNYVGLNYIMGCDPQLKNTFHHTSMKITLPTILKRKIC